MTRKSMSFHTHKSSEADIRSWAHTRKSPQGNRAQSRSMTKATKDMSLKLRTKIIL